VPEAAGFSGYAAPSAVIDRRYRFFLLAHCHNSWQKLFSLRVKKEFIFNPADGGQENLGRQRNGGCQFDRLPIRGHFCRLRQSLEA
jgi:hypothetical protein